MQSSAAPSTRGLRNRPLGRLLLLGVVLLGAFAVSRSCGSTDHPISKDEAIEIASESAELAPDRVQIRFVQRGIPPRQFWAVSLYTLDEDDRPDQVELVLVDAQTGEIDEA
jgi:hypothetical protein